MRCSWDQVEKVNDGRADFHLLKRKSQTKVEGEKKINKILGHIEKLDMDISSDNLDTLPLWKDKDEFWLKA